MEFLLLKNRSLVFGHGVQISPFDHALRAKIISIGFHRFIVECVNRYPVSMVLDFQNKLPSPFAIAINPRGIKIGATVLLAIHLIMAEFTVITQLIPNYI